MGSGVEDQHQLEINLMEFLVLIFWLFLTTCAANLAHENGRDMWLSVVISFVLTPVVSIILYLSIGKKKRPTQHKRARKRVPAKAKKRATRNA